jgi:hypothetical protein
MAPGNEVSLPFRRGIMTQFHPMYDRVKPPAATAPATRELTRAGTLQPLAYAATSRFAHDFSRIPVRAAHKNVRPDEDAEEALPPPESEGSGGAIQERLQSPQQPSSPPSSTSAPASGPAKKAGVSSFVVKWTKNSAASATNSSLRLDFNVTFLKDATHDPAAAEFRQNAGSKWEVTAGPHKGQKNTTVIRDDGYSRADDKAHTLADVTFKSNDNPGLEPLHKDDVLDYSFTAEQMVIDTTDSNKVVAKRGPHTGTIKGKHPRTYAGVPKTLSS